MTDTAADNAARDTDVEQEVGWSRNRAAFLTGLYVFLPHPALIVEPLLEVSGALQISKLILLDNALARWASLEVELVSLPRPPNPLFKTFEATRILAGTPF